MEFKSFVDMLLSGTPIAILAALVGVIWQLLYTYSRDKLNDEQVKRQLTLEQKKFEYQKDIERLRFEYEQRRWREELGRDITLKLMELRIQEYTELWKGLLDISFASEITTESAKKIASQLRDWRYKRGEILSEQLTADTVIALQKALWEYDESPESHKRVRDLRLVLLRSLRTDIGLGKNISGQTIYQIVEDRQSIQKDLLRLQEELGIKEQS